MGFGGFSAGQGFTRWWEGGRAEGWAGLGRADGRLTGCVRLEGVCAFSARGSVHEVVYCVMLPACPCVRLWTGLTGVSGLCFCGIEEGYQIFYLGGIEI